MYVSFLQDDNIWSKPMNLGTTVNTASKDHCPFLASDGKTLFFSSNGFPGYGHLDIFVSKRLDDSWQNWTEPENLGALINTDGPDGFFTIPASGNYAYFCSTFYILFSYPVSSFTGFLSFCFIKVLHGVEPPFSRRNWSLYAQLFVTCEQYYI